MIRDKHWTAFFSHTGSEIYKLSKKLGRYPDVVVTNRPPGDSIIHEGIKEIIYVPNKPEVVDYRGVLQTDTVVTLHGWMRIVPPEICEEYTMYNLHPGLITQYPELKGKDPQKRVAEHMDESRYTKIGCVVHKVTPGVDEGPILAETSTTNVYSGEDSITSKLHELALNLWTDILR